MRVHAAEIASICALVEMHGRRDDVARRLAAQLDDVFAKVGFDRRHARAFEAALSPISSEIMDLPLVTVFAPTLRQISSTILRASSAVRGKMHMPAACSHLLLVVFEIEIEMRERVVLDVRALSRSASNSGRASTAFARLSMKPAAQL